jgi:O-antigen/teichoic acid export membrane protein
MKPAKITGASILSATKITGEHVRQGLASFTDQAFLSATNFVIGILVARFTAPSIYGAYALVLGVLLALQGVQAALITTPLTILGAPREGDELQRFVSALGLAQVALSAAASVACLAIAVIGWLLAAGDEVMRAFLGLGVACFFIQTQEFFRRVLFCRLLPAKVLLNDSLYCALQLAGLSALWLLERRSGGAAIWLNSRNVLFVTGFSALVGSVMGFAQARAFFLLRVPPDLRTILVEAWEMGRYGLGSQVGQVMFILANRLAAAGAGGTVGVAELEAPRLLVAPLQIIGTSAGSLAAPRAAQVYSRGGRTALLRFLRPVAALWSGSFLAYAAVVAVAPGFWLRMFYGTKYAGTETILVFWCLSYALLGVRVLPQSALRVTRHYSETMWANLAAGGVVVVASVLLSVRFGVVGAASGRFLGEAALTGLLTVMFLRRVGTRGEATT